ncbi:MAG: serine--tRNA ligase, partial [Candidatus Saccharibacteria bacterium]|nr:serine--tRNA ligase [Candidatus Saccharibacteria bacterium]
DDVPSGGEEDSVEIKAWGEKKKSGVDHLDYAKSRDWVDFERGAKVAGAKFYYLKNEMVLLENALIQYGISKVVEKGFTLMDVPDMVSGKVLEGVGFAPRSSDQSDEYFIEGEDLVMIATAEISLTGFHMDEIIDEDKLPLLYSGFSACFRKEAGSAGKHTRGLFRVHQFNKLEMYIFCLPEESIKMHEKILGIEEEIWQGLNIPYRVVNIAAGDLGAPAAKKYDIEYFSPVDQTYRELTSCSNCTDFQARSLNIRVRRKDGKIEVLHTLNGTAVSLARTLVAVIENYAQENGKLKVPEVLKPYLGGKDEL